MKSGKSTLAGLLAQKFDLPILSFAESLREEVAQAFFHKQQKREARYLWDLLEAQDKTRTRPLLQAWGQGRRALVDPDYWVERLQKYADKQGYGVAIIDDVRHTNEALHILNMGGMVIRLDANQQTLINRGATGFAHISEQLEPVDEVLSETQYAHQSIFFDTTGMSPLGMYRRLVPLVDDFLKTWGEEE
jgi:adenylate kinase family enzyme